VVQLHAALLVCLAACDHGAATSADAGVDASVVHDPDNWAEGFGSGGHNHGDAIAVDPAGNIYLTGDFSGDIRFGDSGPVVTSRGHYDCVVVKLDPNGLPLWATSMGGANDDDWCADIAVDQKGSVVVVGAFAGSAQFGSIAVPSGGNYDSFIAMLDSAGAVQWVRSVEGTGDNVGNSVMLDSHGNILAAGRFQKTARIGARTLQSKGSDDVFIAKCSAAGDLRWITSIGGPDSDNALDMVLDGQDNIWLAGELWLLHNLPPGATTAYQLGPFSLTARGSADVLIARISSVGKATWATSFGGPGADGAFDIALGNRGELYLAGYFQKTASFGPATFTSAGDTDIFLARLEFDGNIVWARQLGGPGTDQDTAIEVASNGDIYQAGAFEQAATLSAGPTLQSLGKSDVFVARYDPKGKLHGLRSAGGPGAGVAKDLAIGPGGAVHVVGYFSEDATFGKTQLTSHGLSDIFVWKLSSP